jgi:hypothetical protein
MYPHFKEHLSVLNKHKVKFLVVGAYAVGYHAQPRATKDLDVLIQPAPKNGAAVYRALVEFGAPGIADLSATDFTEKGTFYRMGVPPIAVDILPSVKGVELNAAGKSRIVVTVDAETGLIANFISWEDLIAARLAAGRPKDLGDVDAIRTAGSSMVKPPTKRRKGSTPATKRSGKSNTRSRPK